ncbi:hypothetical protein FACS1894187_12210 [Synergistales bacterium]|nr:hypothetical protein FACS1894187_12210 [Synergistales bacterium]
MRKFIYGILIMAVVLTFVFPAFAAQAEKENFCVIEDLLYIFNVPSAYEIAVNEYDQQDFVFAEKDVDCNGNVVYGNHVAVGPVSGKYADSWVEIFDPEDGSSLGFIEKRGLEALPEYKAFSGPTFYIIAKDDPDLSLQPAKTSSKYLIRNKTFDEDSPPFTLAKGEVATAFGERAEDGANWILLGFDSLNEGATGVGMRYAWAKAADLRPVAEHAPDESKIDAAWFPSWIRTMTALPAETIPAALKDRLIRQGFWIDPAPLIPDYIAVDEMSYLYAMGNSYRNDFITVDLFLHAYHLIFDRMLQKLEWSFFAPTLERSIVSAIAELEKARPTLVGAEGKEALDTAGDMFGVTLALLSEGPGKVTLSPRAETELQKILKADGTGESEITGAITDYTQYRPRGHYTLTPTLERYFRATTFLGGEAFRLFNENGRPITRNVRAAALIGLVLDKIGETWVSFESPIDFLVGTPDDGGGSAYRAIAKKTIGDFSGLGDEAKIALFAEEIAKNIPAPRIQDKSVGNISKEQEEALRTQEFRVSGKRFTFDAFIFHSLTSPRVGTDETPRNMPETADVMAVLGSGAADGLTGKNSNLKSYAENMRSLKGEIGGFISNDSSFYTAWLNILKNYFAPSGSKQFFYNSGPWQWKKLVTASAAWAEMKHDTILYAKQDGGEMGGPDGPASRYAPPLPRGYVEPDPKAFEAIIATLDRLDEFFRKFSFESEEEIEEEEEDVYEKITTEIITPLEYTQKIARFKELCASAENIAQREVAGEALSLDDYTSIKEIASAFSSALLLPGGWGIEWDEWEQLRMAIVADVATDFLSGLALQVATGTPREIYVYVNDKWGGSRVTRGYVYSYYEFARSLKDGRLTDEEWRTIVYDEEREDELKKLHPAWYGELDAK